MLNTFTPQIKVTLPQSLYFHLKSRAGRFDMTLSSYVRNLILTDVKDQDLPTFKMSPKREKVVLNALRDLKQGRTRNIDNIDEYLNSL